jgi:hypothetical protein
VGPELPPAAAVVAGAEPDVVAADDDVELELLLPQPTANADAAIAMTTAETRRARTSPSNTTASLSERQNPGTLTESWQ